MELVTYEDEIKEILIEDIIKSNDNGKIIIKGEVKREVPRADLIDKEIAAIETIHNGSKSAEELTGIDDRMARRYANGEYLGDEDSKAKILGIKYNIADKAVAQLMTTLNLFDPSALEKQTDIVKAAGMLAGIVEKVSGNNNNKGGNEVHLHLYGPKQNKIDKYEVIDV